MRKAVLKAQAEQKGGYRRYWGLKLLELGVQDDSFGNCSEYLKTSTMSELEKVAFVERWAKASEAGRFILEGALMCDVEGKAMEIDWSEEE